jgi:hypothetical protein
VFVLPTVAPPPALRVPPRTSPWPAPIYTRPPRFMPCAPCDDVQCLVVSAQHCFCCCCCCCGHDTLTPINRHATATSSCQITPCSKCNPPPRARRPCRKRPLRATALHRPRRIGRTLNLSSNVRRRGTTEGRPHPHGLHETTRHPLASRGTGCVCPHQQHCFSPHLHQPLCSAISNRKHASHSRVCWPNLLHACLTRDA